MKTSTSVIAALLEFIECLIHQLLHLRKLYSADLFEKQRLYGIAVHRSRHPELNDYISTVVESLQVLQLLPLMPGCFAHPPPPPLLRPCSACSARHSMQGNGVSTYGRWSAVATPVRPGLGCEKLGI